ncbi:uncharacterized protein LOC129985026 [Argiope bruennichi]|uniref:uncharacterized protein LOC129985026 n=1 Tax=Argiope bruennichi TaxID=94029 RepID=UPI002494460E|nr:uncharacterized protein LOC129985026 [Argiope bruennichi]
MEVVMSERRTILLAITLNLNRFEFFHKISSFNKIVKIMAYVIRFFKNMKENPNKRRKGKLDIEEIKTSEKFIFKETQREAFSEKEKLNLRTVKDSEGLLRIETRIASRKYLETFIFSVLLPHKHQMIEKLIMSKHVQLEHAGAQAPMSCIRESFWIIKSRKTVPGVIRKCTKFSARIPLPEDKVRDTAVFEDTSIDLCGPLFLKNEKCCIVSTCHMCCLPNCTFRASVIFVYLLREDAHFIVYSGNGNNLVETASFLINIDWEKISTFALEKRISWKINSPATPWWGGFWERLIGLLKSILWKVLERASLKN